MTKLSDSLAAVAGLAVLSSPLRSQLMRMAEDEGRLDEIHRLTGASRKAIRDYLAAQPYDLWDLWWNVRHGGKALKDLAKITTTPPSLGSST